KDHKEGLCRVSSVGFFFVDFVDFVHFVVLLTVASHAPVARRFLTIAPGDSNQANPDPHSSTAPSPGRILPAPFSDPLGGPPPAPAPDARRHSPRRARSSAPPSTPPAPNHRSRAPRAPSLPWQTSPASTRRTRAKDASCARRPAASPALSRAVPSGERILPAAPAAQALPVRHLRRRAAGAAQHSPPRLLP